MTSSSCTTRCSTPCRCAVWMTIEVHPVRAAPPTTQQAKGPERGARNQLRRRAEARPRRTVAAALPGRAAEMPATTGNRRRIDHRQECHRRVDIAPHGDLRHHPRCRGPAATDSIHSSKLVVSTMVRWSLAGRPGPRPCGAADDVHDQWPVSGCRASPAAPGRRGRSGSSTPRRANSSNRLHGPHDGGPHLAAPPAPRRSCSVARRPVGPSLRTRLTVLPVARSKPGDRVSVPTGPGSSQLNPESNADLVAHGGERAVELTEHPLHLAEEQLADARQLDVPGTAVQQRDLQRRLELAGSSGSGAGLA